MLDPWYLSHATPLSLYMYALTHPVPFKSIFILLDIFSIALIDNPSIIQTLWVGMSANVFTVRIVCAPRTPYDKYERTHIQIKSPTSPDYDAT